jgi:hypothetical protein
MRSFARLCIPSAQQSNSTETSIRRYQPFERRRALLPVDRSADPDGPSFRFSPFLKQKLIASGQLSDIHSKSDYPEERLVCACVETRLDLPSIRHRLLRLNVPVEMADQIETLGRGALPALEQACWEAFKTIDEPAEANDIYFAGPFIGIGWGPPIHDPLKKMSARWIGGAQAASVFVRVEPERGCMMCLTIPYPSELETRLRIQVCGRPVETWFSRDDAQHRSSTAAAPGRKGCIASRY